MWIDLQMSLADIEAEIPPTYLTSYPAYLPWVMQWANVGTIDDALNLNPHVWPFGRCLVRDHEAVPRCKCSSRWMMTAAPVRMRPWRRAGEEAGSRVNGFR
jgi:hypothetical protein